MNRRLLTILLVAFFIAAACTFLVYRLVGNKMSAAKPSASTGVVAAKVDIKLGSVLTADSLTTIQIVGTPPKGAILSKDVGTVVGRGVISDLYAGEPILESRLAAVGSGGGLAAIIPIGMRACSVKVDDVVGVSGFVLPGMRVDVVVSGVPPTPIKALSRERCCRIFRFCRRARKLKRTLKAKPKWCRLSTCWLRRKMPRA